MNSLSELDQKGYTHLYVGDGKGKTTCAAGLAARAIGAGKKVLFCQFLKGRDSCEIDMLKQLGAGLVRAKTGSKFLFQLNESERQELKERHIRCFEDILRKVNSGECDVLILDEVVDAVNAGLIPELSLTGLLDNRPEHVEVVMTGRNPGDEISKRSDYITKFVCEKHPFQHGVTARKGIEF